MANERVNKVIFGGNILIDLTGDTITAADVINGKIFHLANGTTTSGTCTFDAYTEDATATAAEILATKTAYVNKNKVTGTMPNISSTTLTISTTNGVTIPQGYHDGGGKVTFTSTELSKIIPDNIRQDVSILGVVGTMSGSEDVHATTLTVTPLTNAQTYTPPTNYNYFSEFTVNAIPYSEQVNAQGGKTVTIAGS